MTDNFLFMADCHIKPRTWTNSLLVKGDSYNALNKILKNNILFPVKKKQLTDTLVIGGDWFDSNRPSSYDIIKTTEFLSSFKSVLYIRGNHDKVDPSYLLAINECSQDTSVDELIPDVFLPIGKNSYITGISYQDSVDSLMKGLNSIKDNILQNAELYQNTIVYVVLHTSFEHLNPFAAKICIDDADAVFKETAAIVNDIVILVGDIHVRNTTKGKYVTVHSPGSIYPTSMDNTEQEHAVSLIESDVARITTIDTEVRAYFKTSYSDKESLDAYVQAAYAVSVKAGYMHEPCIFLEIPKGETVTILSSDYPDVVIVPLVDSSSTADTSGCVASGAYTLEQAITDECEGEQEIEELLLELVHSDDPVQTINDWLTGWEVERAIACSE